MRQNTSNGTARRALLFSTFATAVLVLSWPSDARAYPWMIRHGYVGCPTCHSDPSGGELLTAYGRAQGDLLLQTRYGADAASAAASEPGAEESFDSFDSFDAPPGESKTTSVKPAPEPAAEESGPSPTAGFLWGAIEPPEWLLLGGSYRHAFLYQREEFRTFPMQADVYGELRPGRFRAGGSLGVARVDPGSPYARAAQITSNAPGDPNLISRTHYLGVDIGPENEVTVRAGRLNLPFGVRIPEHIMWVRTATRTDRESAQQHGVAVAYNGSFLRGELMGIAGNYQLRPDKYRERGYTGYVEALVSDSLALGASSTFTVAQADPVNLVDAQTARGAHGAFARARLAKPVVLMTEANLLDTGRRQLGYVGFLQVDIEPLQGLHFGATGEVLDQGYSDVTRLFGLSRSPGNGEPRFGGWGTIDWFFLPHFEARFDVIVRQDSDVWLLGQIHVYL